MRPDVLAQLATIGRRPTTAGHIRLLHATDRLSADRILRESRLRPRADADLALNQLNRGLGSIYLATHESIRDDLATADVVLALDFDVRTIDAEIHRPCVGDPPRLELVVQLPMDKTLEFVAGDRLDREIEVQDLNPAVADSIIAFRDSVAGRQLSVPAQTGGRCQRASLAFLSCLRHHGSNGTLLAFSGDGWWHCVVAVEDPQAIIDWTAAQFERDPTQAAAMPTPRIETLARVTNRWGEPTILHPGDRLANVPPLEPWPEAGALIVGGGDVPASLP